MPIRTTTCEFCKQTVTRRASLALTPLDPTKTGRGCRVHPEVQALCVKKMAEDRLTRDLKQMEETLGVLAAVSWARVQCSFLGTPPSMALAHLAGIVSKPVHQKVEAELVKQGYQMTETEMQSAVMMAVELATRKASISLDTGRDG